MTEEKLEIANKLKTSINNLKSIQSCLKSTGYISIGNGNNCEYYLPDFVRKDMSEVINKYLEEKNIEFDNL